MSKPHPWVDKPPAWLERIRDTPTWKKSLVGAVIGLAIGGLYAITQLAGGTNCSPTSFGDWTANCSAITTVVEAPLGKLLISIDGNTVEVTPGLARSEFEKIYTSVVPTRFKVREEEYVYDDMEINTQFPASLVLGSQELALQPSSDGTWKAEGSATASVIRNFDGTSEARFDYMSLTAGRVSLILPSSGLAAALGKLD
jgi:hypothetical protein